MPNRFTFCGEPAQICDAGTSKIEGLVSLTLLQKFLDLFNQRFHSKAIADSA